MNKLSDMLFRYIERNVKQYANLREFIEEPILDQKKYDDDQIPSEDGISEKDSKPNDKETEEINEEAKEETKEENKDEEKQEEAIPLPPLPVNKEFVEKCMDSQARDIISSIRKLIQKYLKYTNKYKMYKIHAGVKGVKLDSKVSSKMQKESTLKGIFLKEKITSNTVIKKIRDIILLYGRGDQVVVIKIFEEILGYQIDVL